MNPDTLHQLLIDQEWRTLFIEELGWNGCPTRIEIALFEPGQQTRGWATLEERRRRETLARYPFVLQGVGQKCGVATFVCSPYKQGKMPEYLMRCEIERRLSKYNHHHLIVFTDADNTTQIWQWPRRTEDGTIEYCEHSFHCFQKDEELLQRLGAVAFSFNEEETLTLVEVLRRVHTAFYYTRSKKTQWRLRLDSADLSQHGEVVEAWARLAYARRGLPRDEELRLAWAFKTGDRAAGERLVEAHLYLPLETAWKFKHRHGLRGTQLEDLIHEGYFGLWRALNTFEPDKGVRFQAHAAYWVRNLLDKATLRLSRMIRFPAYIDERFQPFAQQYALVADRLAQQMMREPTRFEVASALGVPSKYLPILDVVMAQYPSLESLYEQGEITCEDCFNMALIPPMSEIERLVIEADTVERILSRLNAKQRDVVTMRYGLHESAELTLEEIGTRLNITRERVRQIENAALEKMQKYLRQQETRHRGRSARKSTEGLPTGETANGNQ